jgi:hypothetical protein
VATGAKFSGTEKARKVGAVSLERLEADANGALIDTLVRPTNASGFSKWGGMPIGIEGIQGPAEGIIIELFGTDAGRNQYSSAYGSAEEPSILY